MKNISTIKIQGEEYAVADKSAQAAIRQLFDNKQDRLVAGTGISIENNVISSVGGGAGFMVSVSNRPGRDDFQLNFDLHESAGNTLTTSISATSNNTYQLNFNL